VHSNFAYTPSASRASQRPSPSIAAPPPESSNVFRYSVPPPSTNSHQHIEQSPNGFQYHLEDDRRAMPPPPVPSTSNSSRRPPTVRQRTTHPFSPPLQAQSQSTPSRARTAVDPASLPNSSSRQFNSAAFAANRAETPRPQSASTRFGQPGGGSGTHPFRPRTGL